MERPEAAAIGAERRHDIDWLRVLAVLLLIPFHTARIFDVWEPFYAKNSQSSWTLSHFIAFVNPWHMPLLFLIAGAATWFALGFRTGGQYAGERFKRLFIPFVFGLLVVVPPQAYYSLLRDPAYSDSYPQFYPHFFENWEDLSGYFGTFTPAHLWFILFLFVFSLMGLPLFLYLRGESGERLLSGLAAFSQRRGAIFLFAVPLTITETLPDIGGKNPFLYIVLFIYGYMLMSDGRFQKALDREKGMALILGVISMAAARVLGPRVSHFPDYAWQQITFAFLRNFNAWFWVVAMLGFGHRCLNAGGRVLRYANEAAYPFYILHQTVIVVIGFYAVQLNVGVALKFTAIAVASVVATVILYDLLVKRTTVTRFLFGMKQKRG
jgi:surface polysaccharide O-acyltransferase-like enzyme